MSEPKRIQRKRERGWRKPEGVINAARGPGQVWANPFKVTKDGPYTTAKAATEAFGDWLAGYAHHDVEPERREQIRLRLRAGELRGKSLMCFCAEDEPHCHANYLLKLANPLPERIVTIQEPPVLPSNLLKRS